jgi:hypothetical protein
MAATWLTAMYVPTAKANNELRIASGARGRSAGSTSPKMVSGVLRADAQVLQTGARFR